MRNIFVNNLIKKRKNNKKIFLITGDLGFSVFENFEKKFPISFINAGVAEQNMVGLSSGLSISGNKVYIYSINNFLVFRALEQIRNDICYHGLDVKIVTVGSGFAYGTAGYSHYGIEDISIMRNLPNIKIYCPADPKQLSFLFNEINNYSKPLYLRLGKGGEKTITSLLSLKKYKKQGYFELKPNQKINFLCFGSIAVEAYEASKILREKYKINVGVISLPIIDNKINRNLAKLIKSSSIIITLEDNILINGFGTYIFELYSKQLLNKKFFKLGVSKRFDKIGDNNFMKKINKIDCESLIKFVKKIRI
tara:strand:+ start:12 stop:935 length:924 start_codon:yes stop_codon:yes gene_type:complete